MPFLFCKYVHTFNVYLVQQIYLQHKHHNVKCWHAGKKCSLWFEAFMHLDLTLKEFNAKQMKARQDSYYIAPPKFQTMDIYGEALM